MKLFELHRDQDETGVSGVGVVALGVIFDDGSCALRWLTETSSTTYACVEDVEKIHGHQGKTRVVQYEVIPVPTDHASGKSSAG